MIDIIIPVLNEEKILVEKREYYQWLKMQAHLIFVDGGSQDQTVSLAKEFGDVLQTSAGRARQMNEASQQSKADFLLFLHVDTFLTEQSVNRLKQEIENGMRRGCFTLKIEDPRFIFRIFEFLVNIRARYFRIIDGDLGLIIARQEFEKVGEFDQVNSMEDIYFSKKIKKLSHFVMIPEKINVSSRLWHERGFTRVLLVYSRRYLQYWINEFLAIFRNKPLNERFG